MPVLPVPLIAATTIVRTDEDGLPIFAPISIEISAGDRIGLRGPSGVGKTLLLRVLALLDQQDGGELRYRGAAIANGDVPAYRRAVHLTAQAAPMIRGTVRQNLEMPFLVPRNAPGSFDLPRVTAHLEGFGLADLLARDAGDLSGGERQAVALIRALSLDPTVLLLDEPTSAMDPTRTAFAESLIVEWHRGEERASVWVSHDAEQIARTTSRSLTMRPHSSDEEE